MQAFQVIVGNIGTVYTGYSRKVANRHFAEYVEQSKSGVGRAGNENVTLFADSEIIEEYVSPDGESE